LHERTALEPSLITAYQNTLYRVLEGGGCVLRVGEPSPPLLALYRSHAVSCAAFITACNPLSQLLSDAENQQRQAELAAELARRSLTYLEGVGQSASGDWPGEPSFLVLGLALEAAKTMGRAYGQNAIVWCDAAARPELVLLR